MWVSYTHSDGFEIFMFDDANGLIKSDPMLNLFCLEIDVTCDFLGCGFFKKGKLDFNRSWPTQGAANILYLGFYYAGGFLGIDMSPVKFAENVTDGFLFATVILYLFRVVTLTYHLLF